MAKGYFESTFGMNTETEPKVRDFFTRLFENYGSGMSTDLASIFKSKENAQMFLETVNNILEDDQFSGTGFQNAIMREDAMARSIGMNSVVNEMLNESTQQGLAALRPISLTSFGFQIRSYVKAVMHRVVKTLQAEKPAFKISERKQFLIDINGNKRYFIDAFNYGSTLNQNLHKKFNMTVTVPTTNYDIFTENSIDTRNKLAIDISLGSFTAVEADGTTAAAAATLKIVGRKREIDIETGRFSIEVQFGSDSAKAILHGEFDFSDNKLVSISSTSTRVKTAVFAARLSSETHLNSLVVGFEHTHTNVNIPDGTHIEVELSQEFTDDSSRMLGINVLEEYTNQMGTTIERLEDIYIYDFIKENEASALVTQDFDITPDSSFALGREEWLKHEFHPFIERICIRLKSELQIDDCHFRVVGNPMDVRIPNSSEENYIFRRNQEMTGSVKVNYDFAVISSGNTVFYISTERVAPGKMYVLLIPNSIENNIITFNHYRYANYVSNKYRSSRNPALPTVMVSSRYKAQSYLPVLAVINILNNYSNLYTGFYNT